MLESLLIQNFRIHEKRRIDFDPRITTLTGPTNSGKTAAISALRWVCLNSPRSDAFIRRGARGASVQLLADGHKIGRRRGKGTNCYVLDGEEFHAIGTSVPDTIADVLRVGNLNFQGQFDSPFWFGLTAPEVSRQLNAIVDLDIIDESLANVGKVVRSAKASAALADQRLLEAEQDVEGLVWVSAANVAFEQTEAAELEWARSRASHDRLRQMTDAVVVTRTSMKTARDRAMDVQAVFKVADALREDVARRSRLQKCIELARESAASHVRANDLAEISVALQAYDDVSERAGRLSLRMEAADRARIAQDAAMLRRDRVTQAYEAVTAEGCPICGGVIS